MHREAGQQSRTTADLEQVIGVLRGIPTTGPVEQLRATLDGLERVRNVTAAVEAQVSSSLLRADVPSADGAASSVSWMADTLGVSKTEASRRAVLADTLDALPATASALMDGRIGEAQAVEIAKTVKRGRLGDAAATEAQLLEVAATSSPEMLRDEVRRREDAADADTLATDEQRAYRRRRAWWRHDKQTGTVRVGAELDPANGAVVLAALNAFVVPDTKDTPDELRRTGDQLRADALIDLCHAALQAGTAGDVGGVRPHVNVLVHAVPDPSRDRGWRFAGDDDAVGPLSGRALDRFFCDATIRRVVLDPDGMPTDVGRATRTWPAPIRAAITARDRHCRFPGCDRPPARCIVHHVTYWRHGGPTKTTNGILLCWHHHHVTHTTGWTLTYTPATNVVHVRTPHGVKLEDHGHRPGRRRERQPT